MVNIWNAYQCMVTFNMSRSASFYESGIGRGMGFRDSNQDLLGFVHMVPGARAASASSTWPPRSCRAAARIHQYQPLTKRGNDDVGSGFNDDPLWLILGVAAYLKETGDWRILDEPVPYDNEPGSEAPLVRAPASARFSYTLDRLGPHGLPLIGRADWNDCLNLNCFSDTPGESFQTTTNKARQGRRVGVHRRPVRAGRQGAGGDLRASAASAAEARRCRGRGRAGWRTSSTSTAGTANGSCAPTTPSASQVGSKECEEGKIFIESQGMCVMAGIGLEDGTAQQALDSVQRAPRDAARHRPAAAGLLELPPRAGRDLLLSAGLQGKRRHLLPQQPVDHHRRGDGRATAIAPSTTTAHQPVGA